MVTNSEAARRPRIPQDDYDGELYCDWCTEQTGSRGKLGVYLNLGGGRLLLGILTRT